MSQCRQFCTSQGWGVVARRCCTTFSPCIPTRGAVAVGIDAPCAVASVGGVTGDVYPSAMSFLAQTANRVVDEAKSAKRGGKLRG
jgi:hypothetical protein